MPPSLFEQASVPVDRHEAIITSQDISRSSYQITLSQPYRSLLGDKQACKLLTVHLMDPALTVYVTSTPEAEAVAGAGAFISSLPHQAPTFTFPRFHLGVPAQQDLVAATFQLAHAPAIKRLLRPLTEKNAGIVYFAREGHICAWQSAIYSVIGRSLPATLAEIHHAPAINTYTRVAQLSRPVNYEGFPETLDTIFLCDPVASGMQQVKLIEELRRLHRLPKTVFVIAPLCSWYGLQVIAAACALVKVRCLAGVLASLLDTTKPLHYYSPYPQSELMAADPRLHRFLTRLVGPDLHRFCIRGNWTGSFWGGTTFPLTESENELEAIGLSNAGVRALARRLTPAIAKDNHVYDLLVPLSTLQIVS